MHHRLPNSWLSLAVPIVLVAMPALAGFSGSDVFVPMAGRQAGVFPSNWYTTLWIHNPAEVDATARVYLLERNTSNPAPPYVDIAVAAGETEKLDNVVEEYFHVQVFGALRVTCATQKLVVTSRVYSRAAGGADNGSVGQDFAAVPASFAIGAGEKTQVLGVYQTQPSATSDFRFNFGLVETTGHTANVRVTAYDEHDTALGSTDVSVRAFSQGQWAFKDRFPAASTEDARLEVEVVSGSGRVIAYGSGIANGSQDPTTFEMTYPDAVLGSTVVQHDATLVGDGSPGAPLAIADGAVGRTQLAASGVGSAGQVLGTDGAILRWQDAAGAAGLTAGGVTFGGAGGALAQDPANLFWNKASHRLGIGTAFPTEQLTLTGNLALPRTTASSGQIVVNGGAFLHTAGDVSNLFLGAEAGNLALTGYTDTGLGRSALASLTTGSGNSAVGAYALDTLTTGSENTAFGMMALEQLVTGEHNSAFGSRALFKHTGDLASAFGDSALRNNTTGAENSAFGASALAANTTGAANSAVGMAALNTNTTGSYNTSLGAYSLWLNTEGSWNVALGGAALQRNTTAQNGTAVGYDSLAKNTTGNFNTAVGSSALFHNVGADKNTGVGVSALFYNQVGSLNTALGFLALGDVNGGSRNVGIGAGAGSTLQTGSDDVYISAPAMAASESATIRIGQQGTQTRAFVAGIYGTTVAAGAGIPVMVDSAGQLGTISSSARVKHDIRDIGDGATAALALRPVSFRYNAAPDTVHFGLIAEEVAAVLPELAVRGADGVPETVAYHELPALLLALLQRQEARIRELESRLAVFEAPPAGGVAGAR
jgi:hypothetical protein